MWLILAAAGGTPADTIEKIRKAFSESLKLPGIKATFTTNGLLAYPDMRPAEIVERVKEELKISTPIIRKSAIKLQ